MRGRLRRFSAQEPRLLLSAAGLRRTSQFQAPVFNGVLVVARSAACGSGSSAASSARSLDVGIELVQPSGERVVDPQLAFVQQAGDHCPGSSVGF